MHFLVHAILDFQVVNGLQRWGSLTAASASFGYLFKTEYTATASMM